MKQSPKRVDRYTVKATNRWKRRLNKDIIEKIEKLDVKEIRFIIDRPVFVSCSLLTDSGCGAGYALCSTIEDTFDENRGKNKAAGRAVKALLKKKSSSPIRCFWYQFAEGWTKRQIDRVMTFSMFKHKSVFFPN